MVTQKIYLSYACNGICEKSGTNTRPRWRAGVWDIFAPYDHSLEPYVRIAVGDYISLVEKRGEMNAAYALLKSFSFEKNKFSYRVYDGIGIEKLKEEITRWESIFDSELSILRNWDYISTFEKSYIGIDEDTRDYFDELIKNEVNSTDIPEGNS